MDTGNRNGDGMEPEWDVMGTEWDRNRAETEADLVRLR